ncbi:MAG: COQ9 family protein [Alphaproteobacteria bacterium]
MTKRKKTARPKKTQSKTASGAKNPNDDKLLLAILSQAAFDGWTMEALRRGAEAAGVEEGRLHLIYPRGVRDAVAGFGEWTDRKMEEAVAGDRYFSGRRIREKVAFAARVRFEAMGPHREAARQLLLWAAMPHHAPDGLKLTYKACDAIWRAAGDASTDFNFYTKRGLLAYVLKTTMLFWLNDESAGRAASWAFLDRRIEEALRLGQAAGHLKDLPRHLGSLRGLAGLAGIFRRAA